MEDYTNGPSFRIPAGMNVIVFGRDDFSGSRHVLKGSPYFTCQTLGDFAKEVGANSSLWIVPDSTVMVHETDDCSGQNFYTIQLGEGEDYKEVGYNDLNPIGWNDKGRSMRIAQDLMVETCNGNNCVNVSKRNFWGNTESAF